MRLKAAHSEQVNGGSVLCGSICFSGGDSLHIDGFICLDRKHALDICPVVHPGDGVGSVHRNGSEERNVYSGGILSFFESRTACRSFRSFSFVGTDDVQISADLQMTAAGKDRP